MKKQGFTLVEIMIVVLIIGLLAAIAIPNFIKARKTTQMNACIDNLRAIEGAIEQALMSGTPAANLKNDGVLFGADAYIKVKPVCPSTKTAYTIPTDGTRPVCPNSDVNPGYEHVLPGGASGTDTGATDTGTGT